VGGAQVKLGKHRELAAAQGRRGRQQRRQGPASSTQMRRHNDTVSTRVNSQHSASCRRA
jgi:hypothetical protein